MNIVYLGTPDFAAGALRSLIEAGHEISAVVTQPDKAKGRSKELQFPPVKECALAHNIPVMQPVRIKTPEAIAELAQYEADVFVVAAFGQILSQEILDMPKYGCINVHASLLPKLRGGAPIHRAIIEGHSKSGITIMYMAPGMDDGDIISQKEVEITDDETASSLHDKLSFIGKELLLETLPSIIEGTNFSIPQDNELTNYVGLKPKMVKRIETDHLLF